MKKLNLKTGIPFSILVSVVAVLLRLIRVDSADFFLAYYCFVFSLLCWVGNTLLINVNPVKLPSFRRQFLCIISLLGGAVLSLIFDQLNMVLGGHQVSLNPPHEFTPEKRIFVVIFRGSLLNLLNLFFVSHIQRMKEHEEKMIDYERMRQNLLQANLSSLKEQLSPHFLFNSLNTLNHLTNEDKVKGFVQEMANVYRYLLDYQKKDLADLKQELSFARSYLYIIQARLDKAMQVHINIEPAEGQYNIPPLTLQLLIENALKHNVATKLRPLTIDVSIDDGYLVVCNNMQPKNSGQPSSGIGLTNISERYRLLLRKEIGIIVNDQYFTVKLPLMS